MAQCLLVLERFSTLSGTLQQCWECFDTTDGLHSYETDLAKTSDKVSHLQLRYSILVDKMLSETVNSPEELESIKDVPQRGADAEGRKLENLSDKLREVYQLTVVELNMVLDNLQRELYLDDQLLKDQQRQKFMTQKSEREALLQHMERLIQEFSQFTPSKTARATGFHTSWEGVDYDVIGDVFPRLRKSKNNWLRTRLSKGSDVRRRYLRFLGGQQASAQFDKNYISLHAQPRLRLKRISSQRETNWPDEIPSRIEHPRQPCLQVPPPPADWTEGFRCPYCQLTESFDSDAAWQAHVFADLRAYVCTAQGCDLLMFQDRHEWMQHELEAHLAQQLIPGSSAEDCRTDLQVPAESPEALVLQREDSIDSDVTDSVPYPSCGFCSDSTLETLQEYERHVGSHLEQVALLAIDSSLEAPRSIHEEPTSDLRPLSLKTTIDLERLLSLTEGLQLLHRYRIALAIASSHLTIHTSSWVGGMWRAEEVIFEMTDGNLRIDCPYLKRDIGNQGYKDQSRNTRHSTVDNTLISLGFVLLELFFGTLLDESTPRKRFEQEGKAGFIHDWAAALIWANELEGQAGPECAEAVRYCLNTRIDNSANTYWRQELHDCVIAPVRVSYEAMAIP